MRRTAAISIFVLALLAFSLWNRTTSLIVAAVTALFLLFLCIYQIFSATKGGHTPSYQGIPEPLRRFLEDTDDTRLQWPGRRRQPKKHES